MQNIETFVEHCKCQEQVRSNKFTWNCNLKGGGGKKKNENYKVKNIQNFLEKYIKMGKTIIRYGDFLL